MTNNSNQYQTEFAKFAKLDKIEMVNNHTITKNDKISFCTALLKRLLRDSCITKTKKYRGKLQNQNQKLVLPWYSGLLVNSGRKYSSKAALASSTSAGAAVTVDNERHTIIAKEKMNTFCAAVMV